MKKLLLLFVCALCIIACQQKQEGFTINGTLQGEAEDGRVYLVEDIYSYPPVKLDSAIVKDGKFSLKGKVDPRGMLCALIIDINEPNAEEPDYREKMFRCTFYVENSDITFDGDVATLPSYYWNPEREGTFTVKGSATEDLHRKFQQTIKDITDPLAKLDMQYSNEYIIPQGEGKDVTARGIEIVKAEKALLVQKRDSTLKFIKENINSVAAMDELLIYISSSESLTSAQIDEMVGWMESAWAGTSNLKMLQEAAANSKKVAIGEKYVDAEFFTPDGKKVMLSSLIPQDKYVMLEFWASWCGPCRGEIPHLVKVNKKYKDFDIISISIDEKDADWQKAMKEEGMIWKQLRNTDGMQGETLKKYNITGVPTCIVLDKEGKIYKKNMRGAYLDEFLQETYDK